ncbi:MAG: LON peptidase substrate-binding domain-containing protein, partial [Candidatus Omnitrophica bacterium]|nr:LON peptidase substrate-binding domain-containing protein [Candidatus Omnitrophota bacterium]
MAILKKSDKLGKKVLPALPLRDLIIFPNMVVPLLVGRVRSINTVEEALASEEELLVVFQKEPQIEDPELKDVYSVGVKTKVIQSVREQ